MDVSACAAGAVADPWWRGACISIDSSWEDQAEWSCTRGGLVHPNATAAGRSARRRSRGNVTSRRAQVRDPGVDGRTVRRSIVPAVLLAAGTLLASPAAAATPKVGTYKAAKVQRGYDLMFTVRKDKVTELVAHVLETCAGSSTSSTTTVGPGLTWTIKGGKVSGRKRESADGVTLHTTLKGTFTSATTFKGTIRQESIVAGSTCDTYKLKFTAGRR